MNRRRLIFGCIVLSMIAGAITTWYVLARRDADFVVVGRKTKGVRENYAKLEMMIDPADFREFKTVHEALAKLNNQLRLLQLEENGPDEAWRGWEFQRVRIDRDAFFVPVGGVDTLEAPFQLPADARPITLKQFLRMTFAQTGVPDVNFIVRGHYIEATTAERAQDERARYLDGVSVYDRMQNLWKEMTGNLDDDVPELRVFMITELIRIQRENIR